MAGVLATHDRWLLVTEIANGDKRTRPGATRVIAMQAGARVGYEAMVSQTVEEIQRRLDDPPRVQGTGVAYSPSFD